MSTASELARAISPHLPPPILKKNRCIAFPMKRFPKPSIELGRFGTQHSEASCLHVTGTVADVNQKTLLQERTECALQLTRIAGASPGQIKLSVVINNVKDSRKVSPGVIQGSLGVVSMKR